jgi:N-acetylmuramoyl-L-alanine amidase
MQTARFWFTVCAALLLTAGTALSQPWSKLERVEMYGNEYVRLKDWAGLYNYSCVRREDEVTVSNKWTKMVFTINSRQAQIKGVTVHLSVPIARRAEEVFIAPIDLRTTIHPLLYPAQLPKGRRIRTVAIDPGHGGRDPGKQEGKTQEKKISLLLAQALQKRLQEAGFKVVLTRTSDTFVDLPDRPASARKQKADLFISLHFNSAEEKSVKGIETYCMTPAHASSTNARGEGAATGAYDANRNDALNVLLGWHLQKALVEGLDTADRGVRRGRLAVLKLATMPAILIEGGYLTHPDEEKNLLSDDYRQLMAKAICEGIQAYKKAVELK